MLFYWFERFILSNSGQSRVKISANQYVAVAIFNLQEAFHRAFPYVNLLSICSEQAFHFINLSNVGFFIASQGSR